MKLHCPRSSRPRQAFTMIELLVVLAIILALLGILLPAVMQVKVRVDEAGVVAHIKQLDGACEAFKQKYGDHPPSMILLKEAGDYDPTNPFELYSKNYLESIFRGINLRAGHNWNGDRNANGTERIDPPGSQGYTLQGDECLVYFLGGVPRSAPGVGSTPDGFNSDPANPTVPGNLTMGRVRISFFDFNKAQLAWQNDSRIDNPPGGPNSRWRQPPYPNNWPFAVYLDKWDLPYAYFKAVKGWSTDNYYGCQRNTPSGPGGVPGFCADFPVNNQDNDGDTIFDELNDCPSLCSPRFIPYWDTPTIIPGNAVWPSSLPPSGFSPFDWLSIPPLAGGRTRFHKPDSFQIISAGIDKAFGVGGPAPPPGGGPDPNNASLQDIFEFDRDNLTNFAGGRINNFRK